MLIITRCTEYFVPIWLVCAGKNSKVPAPAIRAHNDFGLSDYLQSGCPGFFDRHWQSLWSMAASVQCFCWLRQDQIKHSKTPAFRDNPTPSRNHWHPSPLLPLLYCIQDRRFQLAIGFQRHGRETAGFENQRSRPDPVPELDDSNHKVTCATPG